jgi:hypothetical protein
MMLYKKLKLKHAHMSSLFSKVIVPKKNKNKNVLK